MDFIADMRRCRSELHEILSMLRANVKIPASIGHCHAVKIHLGKNYEGKVFEVSLAVPPDAMGNRSCDNVEFPKTAETLLFCDGKPHYVSEWDYDDVIRFYGDRRASDDENVNKILDEILRLKSLVSGKVVP